MFDYTKMILEKTIKDVKAVAYVSNIATQAMYIIYLVYALIAQTGFWYVNALLLALSTAYFLYFLHSSNHEAKNKNLSKKIRKLYARIKQAVKFFPLAVALYSLCLTVENVNPFTLISTAFMLITWLLQLIFDVLGAIIGNRIELFKEAIEADVNEIAKPVKSVGNFFKQVTGQEVQAPKAPSKNRVWLDEQMKGYRETKAEEKRIKQEEKREQRKQAIQEKKRKFLQGAKRALGGNNQKSLPEPKNNDGESLNDDE
ncbi:MAG: hypothetical protein IKA72_04370 [Clostridia bacterium]|nr:hypothetical protein [Clostridia bacterium]